MVADFAVLLSVVAWTGIDIGFGINTPKLNVPEEFVTTRPERGWFINPLSVTYGWVIPLAIIPALLATILVFLDQQITSVIINRREHKLKVQYCLILYRFSRSEIKVVCSLTHLKRPSDTTTWSIVLLPLPK